MKQPTRPDQLPKGGAHVSRTSGSNAETDAPEFVRGERPTAELVARLLREEMVEGQWRPGTPLRENPLCERFGVSRNTLREALRLLTAADLVEMGLYRGATVRMLTPEDVVDIQVVRSLCELRAIDDSAQATAEQLAPMRAALDEAEAMERAKRPQEQATAQLRFHQALVHLLGSVLVDEFFENAVARLRVVTANVAWDSDYQRPFLEIDKQICTFVETGQRDQATAMMTYYLDKSTRAVIDILRSGDY
jgi:DNA-binding GntR family transcriptional regulator